MTLRAYSVAKLAEHWGVSTTFIYNLLNSGELEGIKLGDKLWRIRAEAVERYEDAATPGRHE